MEKIKQMLETEVGNDALSSSCDLINDICTTYTFFLKNNFNINVVFKIYEEEKTGKRYDTGYTYIKNNSLTIYIGPGLFRIMANGILQHDKNTIDSLFYSIDMDDKSYRYIVNYIFVSCIFMIINHEISHCILKHKKLSDSKSMITQEIDADCFAGSLYENIYTNLVNISSPLPPQNKRQIIAFIIYFSVIYGMFKINFIYPCKTKYYPEFKDRVLYMGLTSILALNLHGHNIQAILNNFYHVYNKFYPTDIEIFNKTKCEYIHDFSSRLKRIYEFLKTMPSTSATPEA